MSEGPFAIGSLLDDRYRIDGVLGTGGMGRVYRAEHTKIGKMVAIKVLHADLNRNREASQRFQREAIASGRLDHPNIVGVSDFGVLDDGACYLVMEVLEGESLGDRLARDHRIHWVEAIEILRGVLAGLRHAHERGVVHRDIKPDNVFLAQKDGETIIKILDFGIAKLYAGTADDPASTRAGLTVGTPAYLSPEQAVGGEITPASDLYSASIVLYEMLAGRAPFEDKDPLAMLGAHVGRRPPAFADSAPGVDIPAPLEEIVQRGLMKAAAERISTAGDYLAMLDAFSPPLHPAPRITGSMASVSGDRGWATPVPGLATPIPGAARVGAATPVPGAARVGAATPVPGAARIGAATPVPGMAAAPPLALSPTEMLPAIPATPVSAEAAPLPRAIRAVSLADVGEPIPLTWIVRSGVVVGLVIVGAIVLSVAARCSGSGSTSGTKSPSASPPVPTSPTSPPSGAPSAKPPAPSAKPPSAPSAPAHTAGAATAAAATDPAGAKNPATGAENPAAPNGKPAAPSGKPAAGATRPLDHEAQLKHDAQLKQLLHELDAGKTCAERKGSIAKLVELHDARALPSLRRARVRTGYRDEGNACLKADAEHAIKELGGTLK